MKISRPIIGITMGDASGIGPEVILKALAGRRNWGANFLVIADSQILENPKFHPGLAVSFKVINRYQGLNFSSCRINLLNLGLLTGIKFKAGTSNIACGRASMGYIQEAVRLAGAKRIDALVTAPISKEALHLAGFSFRGHTELLAYLTKTKDVVMMLVGKKLRVSLVTTHLPLKKVASSLTTRKIYQTIKLTEHFLKTRLGIFSPRIGVSGLNPHSGEGGIIGREEIRLIKPAVKRSKREGRKVIGPVPADVIFWQACHSRFDAVVAMYHDQGLIPLKMLAFDKGVNITLGLPFVRTSPDHGTAFDIAGKGLASPNSMIEAIKMAILLARKNLIIE
ncbi:MAG: 4-hydroxythreonine-4-phosphate dehydrogenase PdxA [Candidatus Omnitrophota bacterium]|nr:4-hydroxythreonine-4-phosphate dehydrogenase PdxA [Candidatus Omnitrophota bacterium]